MQTVTRATNWGNQIIWWTFNAEAVNGPRFQDFRSFEYGLNGLVEICLVGLGDLAVLRLPIAMSDFVSQDYACLREVMDQLIESENSTS